MKFESKKYAVIVFSERVTMQCFVDDMIYHPEQPYLIRIVDERIVSIQARVDGTPQWVPAHYLPDLPQHWIHRIEEI